MISASKQAHEGRSQLGVHIVSSYRSEDVRSLGRIKVPQDAAVQIYLQALTGQRPGYLLVFYLLGLGVHLVDAGEWIFEVESRTQDSIGDHPQTGPAPPCPAGIMAMKDPPTKTSSSNKMIAVAMKAVTPREKCGGLGILSFYFSRNISLSIPLIFSTSFRD